MNQDMLLIGKLEDGDKDVKPMMFQHPKHETDCCYLVGKNNIYEMQTFEDEEHCSLFIDNFVSESNAIYLMNKMDPIYLLISSLLKNRKKSHISDKYCISPLDQLLNNNEMEHIFNKLPSPNAALKQICNVQNIDDDIYCVLDDDKVIDLLNLKVNKIEAILKNNASMELNTNTLNESLCIINEYIPDYYFQKLCEKYQLNAKRVMHPRKRKISDIENNDSDENGVDGPNNKKRKLQHNDTAHLNHNIERMNVSTFDDNVNNNKTVKIAQKSRSLSKLAKVNTRGMKSMMSYFGKKK